MLRWGQRSKINRLYESGTLVKVGVYDGDGMFVPGWAVYMCRLVLALGDDVMLGVRVA